MISTSTRSPQIPGAMQKNPSAGFRPCTGQTMRAHRRQGTNPKADLHYAYAEKVMTHPGETTIFTNAPAVIDSI